MDYTFVADLATQIEIPPDGTLSRTLHRDDQAKVVLFAFDAGQELSEHTAARPALIHVVRGRFRLTLNGAHALRAETPAVMVLTLLGG